MATLIRLLQSADSISCSLRNRNATLPAKTHDENELLEILDKVDAILSQHRGTRCLWVNDDYTIQEMFGFDEKRNQRDDAYAWEVGIIGFALDLLRNGSIQRLKTCRECQKWYYANSDHQIHCSLKCRQRFASHDSAFLKRRREYMRKYRRDENDRDKRAQVSVRRKTK